MDIPTAMQQNSPVFSETDLFVQGDSGYHTYRIPALLATPKGTLCALCEGRRDSGSDTGHIDIMLRRSTDRGATWSDIECIATEEGMTTGNPCPLYDKVSGTILLALTRNPADRDANIIKQGKAERTVWITGSEDDGMTWKAPQEITGQAKKKGWTWYATGPGHGIQHSSGRLLVPCNHVEPGNYNSEDPSNSHVIYSDDHGKSWKLGGTVNTLSNESALIELTDGSVYINCRTRREVGCRAYGISRDRGETFEEVGHHEELIEPAQFKGGCQASLLRVSAEERCGRNCVLFCNPAFSGDQRRNLTIRISKDECRTWSKGKILFPGFSGYSDMAVLPDNTLFCLYECGEKEYKEKIRLARFSPSWMESE